MKKIILRLLPVFLLLTKVEAKSLYDELYLSSIPDNQLSEYVANPYGIDFQEPSSDTNGKGIYLFSETRKDSYPILYFRGDVSNNFVLYQNFCWQILRTTEEGAIKLMYAGFPQKNQCINEKEDLTIGKSPYNDTNTSPKYGWTYLENDEEKNSLAKEYLDKWFEENLLEVEEELEDVIFCNDRRKTGTYFNAVTRLEEGKPSLDCEKEDRYTVKKGEGNQLLNYPTAIITGDEVTLAGEVIKKESSNPFVNIGYSYWSMTPYSENKNMYPNSKGMLNRYTFTYNAGIRPVIAVKNSILIEQGEGTKDSPYILTYPKNFKNPETCSK